MNLSVTFRADQLDFHCQWRRLVYSMLLTKLSPEAVGGEDKAFAALYFTQLNVYVASMLTSLARGLQV